MNQEQILKAAAEAARAHTGGHQQPAGVPPQPTPLSVQMGTGQDASGQRYVVLVIMSPVGQHVFHFDPEGAEAVAKRLSETARLARTGLEIARI